MIKYIKKTIVGLVISLILVGVLPLNCSAISSDKIDNYVTEQMKQTHIKGLSIGIVKDNKIVYIKGYGNADTGRNVTGHTPFEIGSVSKSITALAIMQLKEKGLIDLDTPVNKYLPWFKAYYKNQFAVITVRQLLNQNSGVPPFYDNDAKADATIEQVVKEKLNNLKLVNPPGTEFLYSNANYNILGEIVQVVSGQSYKEYIEKNVFIPLEMKHSYVSKKEAMQNDLAAGYRTWFGFPVKADLPYFEGNAPSGHIISCAEDMCHYLSAIMCDGRYKDVSILSPEGIKTLLTPSVKALVPMGTDADEVKYAMGWGVNFKKGKIDLIEHTGETSNYHAHAVINPEKKVAVIEMDDVGGFITAGEIAPGALKIATNEKPSESQNVGTILLIVDMVYIIIAILLVISAVRLRNFKKRILKSNIRFIFNIIFTLIINIILPITLVLKGPAMSGATWKALIIFSPDISLFLILVSIVLFIIGIFKSLMIFDGYSRKTEQAQR